MKRKLRYQAVSFALVLILTMIAIPGCGKQETEKSDDIIDGFTGLNDVYDTEIKTRGNLQEVAAQGEYSLLVNGATAEITVKNQSTGNVWTTNPVNRSEDTTANGTNMELLHSQVAVEYIRTKDNLLVPVNSYSGCIAYGRYCYYQVDNGIGVRYALGEPITIYMMPEVISVERFEQFVSKLDSLDQDTLRYNYTKFSLREMTDEGTKTALLEKYPILKKRDIYVLGGSSIGAVEVGEILAQQIDETFRKAGYDMEDLRFDYADNGMEMEEKEDYTIYLSIEYRIDQGKLKVTIPQDSIQYNDKYLSVSTISLLPMFGAEDKKAEGDILLPDGSGALIHFNNGKKNVPAYSRLLYASDKTLESKTYDATQNTLLHMPIFGLRTTEKAFVAVIESGDTVSALHADSSGKSNDYNYVYSSFKMKEFDTVNESILNIAGNRVYQKVPFDSDLQISYLFLEGSISYADMAAAYRNYLLENKCLSVHPADDTVPLYLDVVGAVTYKTTFAGIPYETNKPLTTYQQTIDILNDLKSAGIENLMLGYIGGLNGGLSNTVGNKVSAINQLGGRKAFQKLLNYVKENDIDFYPEIEFQYVKNDKWFDGFSSKSDVSKNLLQNPAKDYTYDLATKQKAAGKFRWIVTPSKLAENTDKLLESAKKSQLNSWNIASLSSELNSDFSEKNIIDRQQVQDIVKEQLQKMQSAGVSLSVSGANVYTLQWADIVKSMPMGSGGSYILDASIPFYQIVLHGVLPYTSIALNLGENGQDDYLRAIEYGAIPYYQIMDAENFALKDTDSTYYGINYDMWRLQMLKSYQDANKVLADLQDKRIIDHKQFMQDVAVTTYENHESIIVNYSEQPVTVAGTDVPAKSYVRVGGNVNE